VSILCRFGPPDMVVATIRGSEGAKKLNDFADLAACPHFDLGGEGVKAG